MTNNKSVIQEAYKAFAQGNIPAVLNILSPDITWIEAEGGPYGGVYTNVEQVLENIFGMLDQEWNGFAAIPDTFIAEGDMVIVLGNYQGTFIETNKSFSAPFAHAWKVEDEKVVCFTQYTDTVLQNAAMK